jgi:epoxyqueuosine reductase
MHKTQQTKYIKELASKLGFDYCGISEANFLEDEAPRLESWLKKNMNGKMSYMENYFDMRLDPRLLVDGAKSVISLLFNYYPTQLQPNDLPKISKYAYGNDYHQVIKEKLHQFVDEIKVKIGNVNARVFVDSAPILDKAWAKKSGLGWIGKNSNLINKSNGSFFFIAEIILDLNLEYDGEIKDYCGTCTKCIDACPTDAIVEPYVVDGSKCISYFTIELKDEIDSNMNGKFNDWVFGCDICQDVCPWNRFSKPTSENEFKPLNEIFSFSSSDWLQLEEETFSRIFKKSPIKRTKLKGIKRNINFIQSNNHES